MSGSIVSIIIPCYNHGAYIDEALQSITDIKATDIEVIIINDGSTDTFTINKLKELQQKGYHVINQQNQGLSAARNNGISVAKGKYILPLDSDNRLHQNYLTKAIAILDQNADADIVYGDTQFFGAKEQFVEVGPFDFGNMLIDNRIDACALYRKSVWEAVKGYDPSMPRMIHEDWEFWMHAYVAGKKFYYLNELCFYYRWLPASMSRGITPEMLADSRHYIYSKHSVKIITLLLKEYHKLEKEQKYIGRKRLKSALKLIFNIPLVRPTNS